ncbi:MAG: hypothetical protein ACHP9Z_12240, partial [Streptosporangiales bacterium]
PGAPAGRGGVGVMPEFIRPQRAIIVEGGGSGLELLGPVVVIAALALAAGAVLLWLVAHLVLIAAGVGVLGIGTLALVQFLKRWMVCVHDVPEPATAVRVTRGYPLPRNLAITQAPRAIAAPAQHIHLHFHGLPAEDIAAIIRRQETPGRPAIEEDPWSPSSSLPS